MIVSIVFFTRFNRATKGAVDLCFLKTTSIFPFQTYISRSEYYLLLYNRWVSLYGWVILQGKICVKDIFVFDINVAQF